MAIGIVGSLLIGIAWWDSARGFASVWVTERFTIQSLHSQIYIVWGDIFLGNWGYDPRWIREDMEMKAPLLRFTFEKTSSSLIIPTWSILGAFLGVVYLIWLCAVKWVENLHRRKLHGPSEIHAANQPPH